MMDLRTAFRRLERTDLEHLSRQNSRYCYLGEGVALTRVLDAFNLYVSTEDLNLTPHLIIDGFWEMWVSQALAMRFREGWRAADIGANVGYYTLMMSKLGASEVVAFDPNPNVTHLLKKSAQVNGAKVQVERVAVAPEVGWSKLHHNPFHLGASSLVKDEVHSTVMSVQTSPLTRERFGEFDFIKIDVEHQEADVMRSLGDCAARAQVLLELDFRDAHAVPLVTDLMVRYDVEEITYDATFKSVELQRVAGEESAWLWLTPLPK